MINVDSAVVLYGQIHKHTVQWSGKKMARHADPSLCFLGLYKIAESKEYM